MSEIECNIIRRKPSLEHIRKQPLKANKHDQES